MGRLRSVSSLPQSRIRSWFVSGFGNYLIFYRDTLLGAFELLSDDDKLEGEMASRTRTGSR
jgi:hypothetical protein